MTTKTFNPLNTPYQGEQDLVQNMTDEAIQICGVDMSYIIREKLNRDYLFGESPISDFKDVIVIEMEIVSIKSFGGDGDILSHFGIEHTDEATFRVSSSRFKTETVNTPELSMPREGDLIYLPTGDSLWEIRYVKFDENYQRFGKNYSYRLVCNLFQYSGEEIKTGDENIDAFNNLMDVVVDPNNSLLKTLMPTENNFNEEKDFLAEEVKPYNSFNPDDPFGDKQ